MTSELVRDRTFTDLLRKRARCVQVGVDGDGVDTARVGFEVARPPDRFLERARADRPTAVFGEVDQQRQRGNEAAVLGEMALDRGVVAAGTELALQLLAPCIEQLLRIL